MVFLEKMLVRTMLAQKPLLLFLVISLSANAAGYKLRHLDKSKDITLTEDYDHLALKKSRHPTLTYFKRLAADNTYVDSSSEYYGKDIQLPAPNGLQSQPLSASINVQPPENISNGGKVKISWEGVTQPSNKDWIGFYCPKNDTAEHYLDYLPVAQISPTWSKGYGSTEVNVFNLRTECEFRYYNKLSEVHLAARSAPLKFKDGPNAPLQGRLMLTRDPSQMRVMWTSGYDGVIYVKYGTSEDHLDKTQYGKSSSYSANDMCEAPATTTGFWNPGYMHDVLLADLEQGQRYFYSFGSDKVMSPVFNFTTAIPVGDYTPYTFIVYGDMGIFPAADVMAKNMLKELESNHIQLIYRIGDISYAEGRAYIWEQWHELIQPYSTLVPYMVGIGNHEQDHLTGGAKDPSGAPGEGFHPLWGNYINDSGGECGVPMYKRFHMPDNGNKLWWYSFDYGMVHYVMMSTEHNFEPGSRQYLWLENDLKKVDRKKTPWVIFGGHRAMYSSAMIWFDFVVSNNMKSAFEDLLHEYKVDLAFWAHYHSYERTCKVYRRKCTNDGLVHIVAGTAGAGIDKEGWFEEPWSVRRISDHGYGRVRVANSTSLYFEWIRNDDKKVLDSFWLNK